MTQYMFGTGQIYGTPVGGGAPLRIGALQDASIDFSGDIKQLYGQYQYPLDVARGKTKIEGKVGTANIDVNAYNQLYFGETLTTGSELKQVTNEAVTVPAATPFTAAVANGATFYMDLGVAKIDGTQFKQVTADPEAGEYSVDPATGTYTFAEADASANLIVTYIYTAATAGSGSVTINNQLMGNTPKFQMVFSQTYNGKQFTLVLFSCTSDKLSLPLKQDDYTMPEVSFQAQANDANEIGIISTTSATGGGA